MTWWEARIARFERGTSAVEYALLITGIAIVMVAVVGAFNGAVAEMWADVVGVM